MAEREFDTIDDPIPRRALYEHVVERVRDLIIEGQLVPGERVNEATLGQHLGVSRTPLREAMRTLAAEGLVDIRPSRGTVVRRLTREDIHSMLEVLAELERMAGRLACQRADDEKIDHLLALHEEMMRYYRARDRLPYYKLNQAFHTGVARASKNPTLMDVQGRIQARLKRIRFIGNQRPEAWADAVAEHEEMAVALRARDGERLGQVLHRHLFNTWSRVQDVV